VKCKTQLILFQLSLECLIDSLYLTGQIEMHMMNNSTNYKFLMNIASNFVHGRLTGTKKTCFQSIMKIFLRLNICFSIPKKTNISNILWNETVLMNFPKRIIFDESHAYFLYLKCVFPPCVSLLICFVYQSVFIYTVLIYICIKAVKNLHAHQPKKPCRIFVKNITFKC